MKLEKKLSPPGTRGNTRGIYRRLRLPTLLASLSMLATFGCQQPGSQKTDLAPPPGAELFNSKCGKCHDHELIMSKYRSAEAWFETIERMRKEHHADIRREEVDLLVNYHVERQQQAAAIFNEKCQKCHPGKAFLELNLSADQARSIIKRMQKKAGNTIEDKDIEIIVGYHAQAQKAALEGNLSAIYDEALRDRPDLKRGMALFLGKCSPCHQATRALTVTKDPEIWAQTIKRMQYYSKGEITDLEARELIDFHVTRQQREFNTFKETCTKCHDDERINSRSLSEEQWLATIKRMQQKAPELISDEKVNLIAAYFHRRELTMARIFYGKCRLCHPTSAGSEPPSDTTTQMDGLISLARGEFGQDLQITDVNTLLATHVQRQKREMQLYENKCSTCHPDGLSDKKGPGKESPGKRTRAEWISFISTLQGVELSKEIQNTINSQIDFHMSRH